ncbi:MAG: 3-isopropylmalate dehydrogenase [Oscillospiraceae bacterium]|jgi:3-isopropylmalate dehydrogenase|nr:3-isopropylmalate dehydrogenase [Oscillospiraceae bacterium]
MNGSLRRSGNFEERKNVGKQWKICVLPGDGIGPEVTRQAVKVYQTVADYYRIPAELDEALIGGAALEKEGMPLPMSTLNRCRAADAILLGAVGDPKWDDQSLAMRPESGLSALRAKMGLYANLRPAVSFPALEDVTPLPRSGGFDLIVVRELSGGLYFGDKGIREEDGTRSAYDVESYSEKEIERIARYAFQVASQRRCDLVSIDKASMLESSRLWREVVERIAPQYPQVSLRHLYADHAAMELVRNPKQFDVILTSNLFGDLLSEEAAALTGSVGLAPSASLGYTAIGIYEAVHGSAPLLAGRDVANPVGAILSVAMMLRYTYSLEMASKAVEWSVMETLKRYRTADIASPQFSPVGTEEMGNQVVEQLKKILPSVIPEPSAGAQENPGAKML